MQKSIKYYVCFFIALFLLSCNNDELGENKENVKDIKIIELLLVLFKLSINTQCPIYLFNHF